MSVFPLFGRRRARLSFMLVYPNLVYPGYAGTVMSVHPDPVNPSQLLYRHLAPTRGLPPDISPRSWRGSAASDEGPRQVYPKNPASLANLRHNRCRRCSYVGKHFIFQLDVSLYVGSFRLAGKTARLVRVIDFSTWQSISVCRLGSCARRDVPLARTPPTSRRSPRRPCMRQHLIAVGLHRPRRLGSSPIQCAA